MMIKDVIPGFELYRPTSVADAVDKPADSTMPSAMRPANASICSPIAAT